MPKQKKILGSNKIKTDVLFPDVFSKQVLPDPKQSNPQEMERVSIVTV